MAESKASAPWTESIALTTAYTGTWRVCMGNHVQIVSSTGGTVAYTVKTKSVTGDVNLETVPAGSSPYTLELTKGGAVYLDILAASGTPTAYLTVT